MGTAGRLVKELGSVDLLLNNGSPERKETQKKKRGETQRERVLYIKKIEILNSGSFSGHEI